MINRITGQEIFIGDGRCTQLSQILLNYQISRILLVCGRSFQFLEISKYILDFGIEFIQFSDFSPNPKYEDIAKGVKVYRDFKCCMVLAIGGGSAMDVAKCIKLFGSMPDDVPYYKQVYQENSIPLIAIPTTAGTGSESTKFAVIYVNGEKLSVNHPSIIPEIAILEPSVLQTLPLYQKKCCMLDALCQALEAWWSVNSTEKSIEYSRKAVFLICEHMNGYLENTHEGNLGMLLASNWAGQAINITQTTAPHAMSYKMTSLFGIPHGHAVAISFHHVWRYMADNLDKCVDSRGKEYVQSVFIEMAHVIGSSTIEDAILWFEALLCRLKIHAPLDVDQAKLHDLVDSVNIERLKNSPITLDRNDIMMLYRKVLGII